MNELMSKEYIRYVSRTVLSASEPDTIVADVAQNVN